jgi:AraC-like DNA-binding protein
MAKIPKIQARMACFVIEDLRRRRIPVDGLLKEVGLRRTDVDNPENRLPQAAVFRLIESAARLAGDPSYGLRLGAAQDARARGVLGFLALNSPTLIDAMINMERFYKVAREGGEFEIERKDGHVTLRFRPGDPALRGFRQNAEFLAATTVRVCRDLTRHAIFPIGAEFIHEKPNAKVEYEDILGCPIKFGQAWDSVIYTEETMRLPVEGADIKLRQVLELMCQRVLGPAPEMQDLVRKVRELILDKLPTGLANIDVVAEELNVSSKTLERRLAERGESFSGLLDGARYEAAKHYLEATDMRISQIAYMAGYTEPSALVRAFKRWTGRTPLQFRDRPRPSMPN